MRAKNKKTFELSSITKYKQEERRLRILPFACLAFVILGTGKEAFACYAAAPGTMAAVGVLAWFLLGTVTFAGIPYLVMKTRIVIRRRIAIQNCTIDNIHDFDYYRDKLTGLSPATISILSDLQIEQKKDVAASVLQYENLGLLVENADHTYQITEKYNSYNDLNPSDRYLIEHLVQGDFNAEEDVQWKEMAMDEAFEQGYIVRAGIQKRKVYSSKKRYVIKAILIVMGLIWLFSLLPRMQNLRPVFQMELGISVTEHIDFVCSQPKLLRGLFELYAFMLFFMIALLYNPKTHVKMHSKNKIGFVVLLVYLGLVVISMPVLFKFDEFGKSDHPIAWLIEWCSSPRGVLAFFGITFLILYTMFLIAYAVAVMSPAGADIVKSMTQQIRRTDYGNHMAECVYGMKNFIHDYSNLSEADRRQVVLWEDYLVYAVVLEENEQIVKEIVEERKEML